MSKTLLDLLSAGLLTTQDGNEEVEIKEDEVDTSTEDEAAADTSTDESTGEGESSGDDEDDNTFGIDPDNLGEGETSTDEGEESGDDEGTDGEESGEVTNDEIETEILEISETEDAIAENNEAVEEGQEVALAVQSFYANLAFTAANRGGMTIEHAEMASSRLEELANRVGLDPAEFGVGALAVQSYQNRADAAAATQGAMDAVKKGATKVWDLILLGIAKGIEFIKKLIAKVFNNLPKLVKKADAMSKALNDVKGIAPKKGTSFKSAGAALLLNIDGKTASPVEAAKRLASNMSELDKGWAPAKLGAMAVNFTEKLSKEDKGAIEASSQANFASHGVKRKDLEGVLPFTSQRLSGEEAKKFGISIKEGEVAFKSPTFPGNKAVVTILPATDADFEKDARIHVGFASISAGETKHDMSIKYLNDSECATVLSEVKNALNAGIALGKKIEGAQAMKKRLEKGVRQCRANYLNLNQMRKQGNGVKTYMSGTNRIIKLLKEMINIIDQPGASTTPHLARTANGLLNLVAKTISARKGGANNGDVIKLENKS